MEKALRVLAPAKLNLHLRVYGRREDGFHDLQSLFQAVSLADEIVVRSLKESDRLEIDGSFDCPPEATTLYRAAQAFREVTGIRTGLAFQVEKRTPAGAGLGGGSSDAASVLRALDTLFETQLDQDVLLALGAKVGSDVPFFLQGGLALVTGRGEKVSPIPAREDLYFLLAYPAVHVATPWAFRLLDELRPDDSTEANFSAEMLRTSYMENPEYWPFLNSFEAPVAAKHQPIAIALESLRSSGAAFVRMSGSGSTVFGVFRDASLAEQARLLVEPRLPPGSLVLPVSALARLPALD